MNNMIVECLRCLFCEERVRSVRLKTKAAMSFKLTVIVTALCEDDSPTRNEF